MTPMFFVVAILGCGDDGGLCRAARVEPTRYETAAACRAALPDALARSRDLDFPSIAADCRRGGMQVAALEKRARRG